MPSRERKRRNSFVAYISVFFLVLLAEKGDAKGVYTDFQDSTDLPQDVLHIGSRLELFIDDYLLDRLDDEASVRFHQPIPREVVIVHNEDWEGSGSGYHSIFKDGNIYRMYYKAWQHEASTDTTSFHPLYCAYAESSDGITWSKPALGIHDHNGSKANNIVLVSGKMGGFNVDAGHPAVFKDTNPNAPIDSRYKAILALQNPEYGLVALKSADGIHWDLLTDSIIMPKGKGHFDSQNLAFWDAERSQYRLYWRQYGAEGIRGVRTAVSNDFIHWHEIQDLAYMDKEPISLYTNQIKPYERAPHIFIGFPARYSDRGWTVSAEKLPELEERERRGGKSTKGGSADLNSRYGTALTETLLMSSRDGVNFHRRDEAFLRPGMERKGTWTYGDAYVGWHLVETQANDEGAPPELSLYATENYWKGNGSKLRRYTLRLDGFASVSAPMVGGTTVTKPLTFVGDSLVINFSSSAAGGIRVALLDENDKPLAGYDLADSDEIYGDTVARTVTWKGNASVTALQGKAIRLKFVLKDADLYSIQFK